MTEYNEWFNELTEEEYNRFVEGLRLVKPKHLNCLSVGMDGVEWRLDGKLVAFSDWHWDGSATYCISNEDIVC